MSPVARTQSSDYTTQNLDRLLHRLQQNVLNPPDTEQRIRRLRCSQFERNRVGANIEYARSLILRVEQGTASPSVSRRTRARNPTINGKRALLRRIQRRLDDLDHSGVEDSGSDRASTDPLDPSTEELLDRYAPLNDLVNNENANKAQPLPQYGSASTQESQEHTEPVQPKMTVRVRKRGIGGRTATQAQPDRGTTTSSTTLPPDTNNLFSSPSRKENPTDMAQLMESHDSTQTALTDSLLQLASALKASTHQFSESLEASNPVVDMAVAALDRNVSGMEKAAGQMGQLRRMTWGWGWWSRIGLWARVGVLWIVLALVMGVMPKFRF